MLFSKQIERQARKAAIHVLFTQRIYDQALQSTDAIEALARGIADYFYHYGTIFFLLKASFLGTHQEVTRTYGYAFAHTYNHFKDEPFTDIKNANAIIDAKRTADEADQYLRKNTPKTEDQN